MEFLVSCGTSGGTTTLCSVLLALSDAWVAQLPLHLDANSFSLPVDSSLPQRARTSSSRPRTAKVPTRAVFSSPRFLGSRSLAVCSWVPGSHSLSVFFLGSWVPLPGCYVFLGSRVPFRGCFLFFSLFKCSFVSAVANELSSVLWTRASSSFVLTGVVSFRGLRHLLVFCSSASFLPFPFVVTRV